MERSTRQREAILRTFEAIDRPLSPIEILTSAKKRVPRLGIATVYRPEFLMGIASSHSEVLQFRFSESDCKLNDGEVTQASDQ
jgi:hypothetical protein